MQFERLNRCFFYRDDHFDNSLASTIFVHVVTGVGKLLNDCCDFYLCVLEEKKRIVTN